MKIRAGTGRIPIVTVFCLFGMCSGAGELYGQNQSQTRRTVTCDESHGCAHKFMNGEKFDIITDNGIVIAAGSDNGFLMGKFISISIIVSNHTSASIDVLPDGMVLEVAEPKERTFRPVTPDKVAKKVNHGDEYASIMKMALNANTVDPGQSVNGSVFFEKDRKAKLSYLLVYVARTVYEFPFANDRSR